jgi:hypothetical protein
VLAKFEDETAGEPINVMTGERRYGLVERYEQEKMKDDADPPFKRILFWNTVYKLYDMINSIRNPIRRYVNEITNLILV